MMKQLMSSSSFFFGGGEHLVLYLIRSGTESLYGILYQILGAWTHPGGYPLSEPDVAAVTAGDSSGDGGGGGGGGAGQGCVKPTAASLHSGRDHSTQRPPCDMIAAPHPTPSLYQRFIRQQTPSKLSIAASALP